jgi:hypothetical protein
MYNASWASCASCARRNAEYVPRAFRRGGRGLLGKVREGVREGLSTDQRVARPRPPAPTRPMPVRVLPLGESRAWH